MRVVDLFCGLGGSSAGVELAGGTLVGAADWCPRALAAYRLNHAGHAAVEMDLSDTEATLRWVRGRRPDVVVASPPCQSYSTAGHGRAGCDLAVSTSRVAIRAEAHLILENVIPFLTGAAWRTARGELEAAGYSVAVLKIKASHLGVAQKRRRAFCVCVRGGSREAALQLERRAAALAQRPDACVHDALPHLRGRTYFMLGCHRDASVHTADAPCKTLRTCCATRWGSGYVPKARDAGPVADAHLLTVPELCVLQGLGADYRFPEGTSRSAKAKLIGNSVVPCCMAWVVSAIINTIHPLPQPTTPQAPPPKA